MKQKMGFSFPTRKSNKSPGYVTNGSASTYQAVATPSPAKRQHTNPVSSSTIKYHATPPSVESATRKNSFNASGVVAKNITLKKWNESSFIGGVNSSTGPVIVTPTNKNTKTTQYGAFNLINQMGGKINVSRSNSVVDDTEIGKARLSMALFNCEDDEEKGYERGHRYKDDDQADGVANEADTDAKDSVKSPKNSPHNNSVKRGSAKFLPKWVSRKNGKKILKGHSPKQQVRKKMDGRSLESTRGCNEQPIQNETTQHRTAHVPPFVKNIQDDELSIPSLITEPDEVPLTARTSSSVIMIPVKPTELKDERVVQGSYSDHTPPTPISPDIQQGDTPKRSGSRLSKYDGNNAKDGVSPSSRGLNTIDTSRQDSDGDEDIFDFSKVRKLTAKTGLEGLWSLFQCNEDSTLFSCGTGRSRSCEPFIDFCGTMGDDSWGLDIKDEDERLAVHFLNVSYLCGFISIFD